jgi:hypothetical protein
MTCNVPSPIHACITYDACGTEARPLCSRYRMVKIYPTIEFLLPSFYIQSIIGKLKSIPPTFQMFWPLVLKFKLAYLMFGPRAASATFVLVFK